MSEVLLRRRALLEKLGISSATLHRKIVAGEIERPLVLGPNMRCWRESSIDAYISSLRSDVPVKPVAPGAKRGRRKNVGEVK